MGRQQLFTVAILVHPTEAEVKEGKTTQMVLSPETVLANNQNELSMQMIKRLDDKYMTSLDRVEIIIRPF